MKIQLAFYGFKFINKYINTITSDWIVASIFLFVSQYTLKPKLYVNRNTYFYNRIKQMNGVK